MKTTSNNIIARRMANQQWGEVQQQSKVADGIWLFSSAGHGGFIVDTNLYPEFREYNDCVYTSKNADTYYADEQHFAPFEEDCEYAKVMWLHPEILIKYQKQYDSRKIEKIGFNAWAEQQMQCVYNSLQQWNPGFLEKYPKSGNIPRVPEREINLARDTI